MTYEYQPSSGEHADFFQRPPDAYPTIHLPVANFVHQSHAERYEGASRWANLILRLAIDNFDNFTDGGPSPEDRFAGRELDFTILLMQATSQLIGRLAVVEDVVHLEATASAYTRHIARWEQKPKGGYAIDSVKLWDAALFDYPEDEVSTVVEPVGYLQAPTQTQYQQNPVLRFAHTFGEFEARTLGALHAGEVRRIQIIPAL